jgi:uncharacterized membrane protein (DUF4010 family)
MGANVVLFPRVLIASAVIAPALAKAVWPAFVAPALVGALLFAAEWYWSSGHNKDATLHRNPLQVGAALQMALLFQVVLWGVAFARAHLGALGLYGSAIVLGLVDMDALTVSVATETARGLDPSLAARVLTIGVLSNTVVKLGIAIAIGRGRFLATAASGLLAMACLLGAAVLWWRF